MVSLQLRRGNARFPRSRRLLKSADYNRVFQQPIKSSDASFILLCRSNNLSVARLGLAVSKKNFPRAVDRNLIKRMIRESFRLHQVKLTGLDIVVINKPGLPVQDKRALRVAINQQWNRLIKRYKYLTD